ncbi:MAG TPA: ParB/RepB/Spo0J family partition protein [Gemmataceae bacterium]|nr:ParB/RepB/Spo0J family partition protein [Gemmataceae bacterium]
MTASNGLGSAERVLELPPDDVVTPAGNRVPALESVTDLLASIRADGQLVPGLVCPHPEPPGKWLCLGGNRRLFCCRVLGRKFKAVAVEGPVTEERQVKLRLTENVIRKNMSLLEIAEDLQRYMRLTGATSQAEVAAALHMGLPEVSRALRLPRMLHPDLHGYVRDFKVGRTVAELIASLSAEQQHDVMRRVLEGDLKGMKRDAVAREIDRLRGRKPKAQRSLKLACAGVVATVKGDCVAALRAFIARATDALKTLERDKLPPEFLGGLMQQPG